MQGIKIPHKNQTGNSFKSTSHGWIFRTSSLMNNEGKNDKTIRFPKTTIGTKPTSGLFALALLYMLTLSTSRLMGMTWSWDRRILRFMKHAKAAPSEVRRNIGRSINVVLKFDTVWVANQINQCILHCTITIPRVVQGIHLSTGEKLFSVIKSQHVLWACNDESTSYSHNYTNQGPKVII